MPLIRLENTKFLFPVLCILGLLSMTIWCFHQFAKNKDISEITYKRFNEDEESVYPHMTLCFENQFDENILRTHNITVDMYKEFLWGRKWSDEMLNVDYKNVSVDVKDDFFQAQIQPSVTG